MGREWSNIVLDDLVDEILDRRGVTPTKLGSAFVDHGHRVISAKAIKSNRVDLSNDQSRFVNDHTYGRWMNTPLRADDVLLTSEAPVGETAYLPHDVDWCLGQRLFGIRTTKEKLHGRFLHYALQSGIVRHDLLSRATGTTAQGIRQSQLRQVRIPIPPIKMQERIAHVLGTLDDRIDLNHRMHKSLEEVATALFKSWFIDFDPVRAIADGREPSLPAHLASLFPNYFVASELGPIPDGWCIRSLDEIASFVNGLVLQKYPPTPTGSLPIVKIAQLRAGNFQGADPASADIDSRYIVEDGDILFSWSGSLECRLWTGGRGALNQHLFKVVPNGTPKWLCYLAIQNHLRDFRAIAAGKATTMGHIQRHHLSDAKQVLPPQDVLASFDEVIAPLVERATETAIEARNLASLRTAMLARLVDGRLRIPTDGSG